MKSLFSIMLFLCIFIFSASAGNDIEIKNVSQSKLFQSKLPKSKEEQQKFEKISDAQGKEVTNELNKLPITICETVYYDGENIGYACGSGETFAQAMCSFLASIGTDISGPAYDFCDE